MKDIYTRERMIHYSEIDRTGRLDFFKVPMFVQDMQTEFFGSMGTSNDILKENDNAGWVLTKARMDIDSFPYWQSRLTLSMYCVKVDAVRVVVEVKAVDEAGNPVFTGMVENCAIDLTERKIRRVSSVTFPQDVTVYKSSMTSKFERLNRPFTQEDQVDEQKVHWSDIDFTNHTNNISYVRYMQHTLDPDFSAGRIPAGMELHYIKESRLGDDLGIFRAKEDNTLDFLIKKENTEIVRARIRYR